MKKLLSLALAAIGVMLMSMITLSCEHKYDPAKDNDSYLSHGDSVAVANIAKEAVLNMEFESLEDLLDYRGLLSESLTADQVIVELSPEILGCVVTSLQNQNTIITKQNILKEFCTHKPAYEGMRQFQAYRAGALEGDSIVCGVTKEDERRIE